MPLAASSRVPRPFHEAKYDLSLIHKENEKEKQTHAHNLQLLCNGFQHVLAKRMHAQGQDF
jgi:hypothetical protein